MNKLHYLLASLLLTGFGLFGCAKTSGTGNGGGRVQKVTLAKVGLDASILDKSVDPCVDFYRFACGGWLANTEIPADQARWSRGFSEIDKQNELALKGILEKAGKADASDPIEQQVGAFYAACMNEAKIEEVGLAGIEPLLDVARRVKDRKTLQEAIATLHKRQIWVVFDLSAYQDFGDATKMIAWLDQNGLGLPDRDYYLVDDPGKKKIREEYQAHVARMMKLAGFSDKEARQAAADVLSLETQMAKASMSRVDRRNPHNIYHPTTRKQLDELVHRFDWNAYLTTVGLEKIDAFNVMVPDFFESFDGWLKDVPMRRWHYYLQFHVIRAAAAHDVLPKAFVDESFRMRATITGQKKQRERWKRCVSATDTFLGDSLGQLYVREKFAGESKAAAERMVHEVSSAFERNLPTLEWMDDATRTRASEKRQKMVYKIGYPDKWKTYEFEVDSDQYAHAVDAAAVWDFDKKMEEIGKPVDRTKWEMTPPTVNAYYNPSMNEMVFPAGILQPPFFSASSATPVNLGGIGMVVGHELTHGFDDSGAQFAGDGNLSDWWEPAVKKKFEAKGACVAEQYSKYEPLDGLNVNGKLTLGENIADMGGIKLAFSAYRNMRKNGGVAVNAEGFNEDQQFFLAVGQAWCSKARDERMKLMIQTDPHSPPQFRVNGPLKNFPEFAKAFGCAAGTPMNPGNACEVW